MAGRRRARADGATPAPRARRVLAAKAAAALRGAPVADVDDVRAHVICVLRHRLVLSHRAEAEGMKAGDVLERLLKAV